MGNIIAQNIDGLFLSLSVVSFADDVSHIRVRTPGEIIQSTRRDYAAGDYCEFSPPSEDSPGFESS